MAGIYDVNAAIQKPDLWGSFQQGRMQGAQMQRNALAMQQAQQSMQDQNALRQLAPQVLAGDPAAYQQAAVINPEAAAKYQDAGDSQLVKLRNMVDYIDRAKQSGNQAAVGAALQQAWPYIKQVAPGAPDQPPAAFDANMEQGWEALKAKVAMAGQQGGANVHSAFRGQNGNMWVLGRDGQVHDTGAAFDPNNQLIDTNAGWVGVNKSNLQAAPVMMGGAQPQQAMAQAASQQYGPPPEVEMQALPGATPEDMVYAMAAAENPGVQVNVAPNGGAQMVVPAAQASTGGAMPGQLTSAPKPAEVQRMQIAQEANARAAEAAERAQRAEERAALGNAPAGFRFRADGSLEPIPGGPKPAGAAATEGERKAATLLQRLNGSLQQLQAATTDDPTAAAPTVGASIAGSLPFVGDAARNAVNSPERQRVESAQLDILDAALTLGTGAAYTKEQLEGYRRSYFPQLGDSEDNILDKQARLDNVIKAARIAAGRAAPSGGGQPRRVSSASDYEALPSGATFIDPQGNVRRKR